MHSTPVKLQYEDPTVGFCDEDGEDEPLLSFQFTCLDESVVTLKDFNAASCRLLVAGIVAAVAVLESGSAGKVR